jgi:hypothetical protein
MKSEGSARLCRRHRRPQDIEKLMTTQRQKRANKANARWSTGPKTPQGKAAIGVNAIRHGLLCRDRILPGEDLAAFKALRNGVWADIDPSGPIESR